MGFLDRLLKKEARKLVAGVLDEVVDSVTDNIRDSIRENKSGSSTTSVSMSSVATSNASYEENEEEEHCGGEVAVVEQRIRNVVAEEWGDRIEIRKNISTSVMGAEAGALNSYTHGLYCDGTPIAMINVFEDSNLYCKKRTRLAKEACERNNVGYVHFLMRLPNRTSYIRDQLKKIVHI